MKRDQSVLLSAIWFGG